MTAKPSFNSVLSIVEELSLDEQQTLVEILKNRLAEVTRKQIVQDIQDARQEFLNGECEAVLLETMGTHAAVY